ncbi:galactose/methyl galactoside ABC transporter permease MglC [Clostridium butyricum]|uniref:Galactoside transport system permease protein MglC n=1 Tax=Clostridium butyricum E4 str. BoNT E BL5262 TaxID=632245 RepID=C4IM89_CLOBU|nr:galactose/methyl galactoside ABC transporter permease MglC [Clostridium butyricum]APF22633.1 branched-chain amino acid transport system / permease component family protein [Clostridium butyricum]EDT74685.1 galactoside transport system permease protein MglC [Clostridium butyricum 5521]EEP52681.1 galactoside transport system permease protein MglC [Clostridium butyricum E4 str. BoNT E BL5262]NFL32215.1 galactose/methyl galactoside ABC transporter permease MglC [Clostridium butyricum]NFS19070.1
MEEGKILSRKEYGNIFSGIGTFFIVLGSILKLILDKEVFYDLPIYIIGVGIAALIYGIKQFIDKKNQNTDIIISSKRVKEFLLNNAIIIALLVLVIIIMIIQPRFMQYEVALDILTQSSTKMIIALGICFTLLIAGTDLSAGRMVGLAAVISTSMLQTSDYANRFFPNMPQLAVIIPIVIGIIACMLFGVLNGFLVAKYDMHPFIATLATQVIVYGACSLYFDMDPNKSQPIGGIRPDFIALGQTKLLQIGDFPGISILVPIAIVFIILVWFILNKTVFGKNVYAIGGNREAAVVSGVNVFATIMGIFIFASLLYGVGGILEAARTAGATNQYGNGYELDAIAACVVGGVSLNGGVGKVSGIVSGVLIFTVIQYGLQFIAVSPMWQQVIKGIIIAVAVAIDLSKYRRK